MANLEHELTKNLGFKMEQNYNLIHSKREVRIVWEFDISQNVLIDYQDDIKLLKMLFEIELLKHFEKEAVTPCLQTK